MKKYLVCACIKSSYTNGVDEDINFTLKADDINSAIEIANQAIDIVKSILSFVKELDVKSVSEIAE